MSSVGYILSIVLNSYIFSIAGFEKRKSLLKLMECKAYEKLP